MKSFTTKSANEHRARKNQKINQQHDGVTAKTGLEGDAHSTQTSLSFQTDYLKTK